jgi:prevent-host-death family protein
MPGVRVGIREFRENLSEYLLSSKPVTITRHGETLGVFIPARPRPTQEQAEAMWREGEQLDALLAQAGVTEEELLADFEEMRRRRRKANP